MALSSIFTVFAEFQNSDNTVEVLISGGLLWGRTISILWTIVEVEHPFQRLSSFETIGI